MYIPPGIYEIDATIFMNTDTILMGDATDVSKLMIAELRDVTDRSVYSHQSSRQLQNGQGIRLSLWVKTQPLESTESFRSLLA